MGLGKTLTMISLILHQKKKAKVEDEKKEEKKLDKWLSKTGNYNFLITSFHFFPPIIITSLHVNKTWLSWVWGPDPSVVASKGTLIICPASLVHHWKKEIERHVKSGRLTVYLYHGPNRERSARAWGSHARVQTSFVFEYIFIWSNVFPSQTGWLWRSGDHVRFGLQRDPSPKGGDTKTLWMFWWSGE